MKKDRIYAAIDLKSFYASVECVERNLDPLKTNLVVADQTRTNKTICLAVSPSLKQFDISGRARLFEVEKRIKEINNDRLNKIKRNYFDKLSYFSDDLNNDYIGIDYIVALPRMSFYIEYATRIYQIYLKYIAPEDIHVYSIDEVFIDMTNYLKTYKLSAYDLTMKLIKEVLYQTGITATAGIGNNLYLAKVAMDIVAKNKKADKDGVRIASLDEMSYRKLLWDHQPLSSFWRIGKGYQKRLNKYHLYTMGDIARFSLTNEEILYKEFGINAELIIDHAWGHESCSMQDIKNYKPSHNSLGSGQVLMEPYDYHKAKIIIKEMVDNLVLDLINKGLMTNNISLYIGYDISNNNDNYNLDLSEDHYGRKVIKPLMLSKKLDLYTSSIKYLREIFIKIYDANVDKRLLIRRINISFNNLISKDEIKNNNYMIEDDLFDNNETKDKSYIEKEMKMQEAIINLKERYGKNIILKGTNLLDGATGRVRNKQIGGHKE